MSQLLVLDDRDSRREIWHLIHRLPPRERIAFLRRCCGRVPLNNRGHLPVPAVRHLRSTVELAHRCDRADAVLTNEIYMDVLQLLNTWGLDAAATARDLEQLVKRLRV